MKCVGSEGFGDGDVGFWLHDMPLCNVRTLKREVLPPTTRLMPAPDQMLASLLQAGGNLMLTILHAQMLPVRPSTWEACSC